MFSLPPGTEMFQFPGFPVPALCVQAGLTGHDPRRVSPFGDPWIVGWLTPPQGLSQFPTSFIGSRCQGIHRVLFFTCRKDCSRSLWSSQGSPAHRCDGLPVGDRWFRRDDVRLKESLPQSCTRRQARSGKHSLVTSPRTSELVRGDSPSGDPADLRAN